jgi:hypothetical protein
MKTNLPNLLTTLLVSITPVTIIESSCLPIKADGFDSINMQMNFSVIRERLQDLERSESLVRFVAQEEGLIEDLGVKGMEFYTV